MVAKEAGIKLSIACSLSGSLLPYTSLTMAFIPTMLTAALAFAFLPVSQAAVFPRSACRCLPGDTCWPTAQNWANLNNTVGGRLVATVPLAAPCHDPSYNAAVCTNIKNLWAFPNLQ